MDGAQKYKYKRDLLKAIKNIAKNLGLIARALKEKEESRKRGENKDGL